MQTKIFTKEEIKDLKVIAIARKYKVSDDYVRKLLQGIRERNSDTAKSISQLGEQILTLTTPVVLTDGQMIGFSSSTDTAFFNCVNFDDNDAANPVGGGFYGKNISGSGWQNPNTKDLCVGVLARSVVKTGDIDVLKKKVSDLESGVIMPDLDLLLKDKTFSVLGDSISTYQGYALAGTFYPKGDVTNVFQTWWGLLMEKHKMTLIANPSVGGARISGTSGTGVLSNNISQLGVNPDIIFVFGGTNDYGGKISIGEYNFYNTQDRNVFKQALCYTFDTLRSTYPNSRIVFMTSMQRNYASQSNGKFPNKITDSTPFQYEYNDAAKETCKIYGIEVVDMYNCGITFDTLDLYTSDRIHPNKAGMELMADHLYKSLIK